LLTIRGWVGPHVCAGGRERPREIESANHVAVGPRVRRRLLPRPLLHAQAASVLDHSRTPPQGDGCAGPAFAGGTERGERNLIVLDPSDVLHDAFAVRGFDMVMAWSVGRLGRSPQDLVGFLSELHALKIDLFLRQQGLDTTTPAGKAMFQMMGVFAEFERAMIAERLRAGLARARGEGKRLGRPPIAAALEKRIREALVAPGRPGVRVIAKRFGVNPGTVQRISRPFQHGAVGVLQ